MEIGYSYSAGETLSGCANYYAWGLEMPGRVYAIGEETVERFTGHERDAESQMLYAGARYYLPALGRWTAVDPMASERLWVSPYNYVQNNPVQLIDPTGALDAPIYDTEGSFLGTDDQGLQGKAIVMNARTSLRECLTKVQWRLI